MILNTNRNISPCLAPSRAGLLTSAAALLALAAFYCAPRLVLAQDAPVPSIPPVPPVPPIAAVQPGQPALATAEADVPTPPPADPTEGGPRYKSRNFAPRATPRPFGVAPAVPMMPVNPVVPAAPAPAALPEVACDTTVGVAIAGPTHASAFPHPMAMAGHGSGGGAFGVSGGGGFGASTGGERSSIEDRLDRLEKMVESLAAEQKAKAKSGNNLWFYTPDQMTLKRQAELSQERAEREVARAQEQMKRAAEEMERASKDQELKAQMMAKDMPRKQLEALRRAREGLQRQMDALDRQIERLDERLERDREKDKGAKEPKEPKEERGRRSEAVPGQPGQKVVAGEVY